MILFTIILEHLMSCTKIPHIDPPFRTSPAPDDMARQAQRHTLEQDLKESLSRKLRDETDPWKTVHSYYSHITDTRYYPESRIRKAADDYDNTYEEGGSDKADVATRRDT